MLDVIPFVTAVDRLADQLRAMPQSTLRRGAARSGLDLARELSRRAQEWERPHGEYLSMPEVGEFVVGDQVAVAGHDLAEALRSHGTEADLASAHHLLSERAATLF